MLDLPPSVPLYFVRRGEAGLHEQFVERIGGLGDIRLVSLVDQSDETLLRDLLGRHLPRDFGEPLVQGGMCGEGAVMTECVFLRRVLTSAREVCFLRLHTLETGPRSVVE